MKIKNNDVNATIEKARILLDKEKIISPEFKSIVNDLLLTVTLLLQRTGINSCNSSKPPADDKNRKRGSKKEKSNRKPGGQPGRQGVQLKQVSNPDKIEEIKIDKRTLPRGNYQEVGYDKRQVIDIETNIIITEYRAQVLKDDKGNRYSAQFPKHVTRPIQYGPATKASSVYMSQFQLIPYKRIEDYFSDQIGLNLSSGSIFNFNNEAYAALELFEQIAKQKLIDSQIINADETGININGKRVWLHTACNDLWTHFYPHEKRGFKAMDEIGILPNFKGVLCHDHWKPYYTYRNCLHSLCNAHHLRELEWSAIEDNQQWAAKMKNFLLDLNKAVEQAGGEMNEKQRKKYREQYQKILLDGEIECPPPDASKRKPGQRGRIKRSKSRNLLERLKSFEDDILRFMGNKEIPFTNNQGENDLRMTKVQQKISGCFRAKEGALIFCRIRGYLLTCQKHGVGATKALESLFHGALPDFVNSI